MAGRPRGVSTSAKTPYVLIAAKCSRREHKRWCILDDPRPVVWLGPPEEVRRLDAIETQCLAKTRKSGHTQPLAPPKF